MTSGWALTKEAAASWVNHKDAQLGVALAYYSNAEALSRARRLDGTPLQNPRGEFLGRGKTKRSSAAAAFLGFGAALDAQFSVLRFVATEHS
jgi:hypothetical protein